MDILIIIGSVIGVILLLASPGLLAALIARLTGKTVHVKTRTGTNTFHPFRTKKERQREDEQDKIVKELNKFCQEVSLAQISVNKHNSFDIWTHDMSFEFPDTSGRPMLTDKALRIANKNNISKVLVGYRKLHTERASGHINSKQYEQMLLDLYRQCS